jgi:hypothetical protein
MNISDVKLSGRGVHKILVDGIDTLKEGQEKIKHDLCKLMSQADERFTVLMQILADEAKNGPRLLSLVPLDRGFVETPQWTSQRFRLTLWCEHSRQPLPLLNGSIQHGVYKIKLPRDFVVQMAPYVRFLTETMHLILPTTLSSNGTPAHTRAYDAIKKELTLAQKSFDFILMQAKRSPAVLGTHPDDEENVGLLLRKLHMTLKKRDPEFGGLSRVQNKRNEFLWVHKRFIKEYYPDLPVIANIG